MNSISQAQPACRFMMKGKINARFARRASAQASIDFIVSRRDFQTVLFKKIGAIEEMHGVRHERHAVDIAVDGRRVPDRLWDIVQVVFFAILLDQVVKRQERVENRLARPYAPA